MVMGKNGSDPHWKTHPGMSGRWKNRESARNHPHTARPDQGASARLERDLGTDGGGFARVRDEEDPRIWLDVGELRVEGFDQPVHGR